MSHLLQTTLLTLFLLLIGLAGPYLIMKGFARIRSRITRWRAWAIRPEDKELGIKKVFYLFIFAVELETILLVLLMIGLPFLMLKFPKSSALLSVATFLSVISSLCWLGFDLKRTCKKADLKGLKIAIERAIDNQDEARVYIFLYGLEKVGGKECLHIAFEYAASFKTTETAAFLNKHSQMDRERGQVEIPTFNGNTEGEGAGSLRSLLGLSVNHVFWEWFAIALQRDSKYARIDWQKHGKLNPLLVNGYKKQAELVRHFPNTYCLQDYAQGVLYPRWPWKFVIGPTSKGYKHIKAGVKRAIGTIGPLEEVVFADGVIRLSIWDATKNLATPMELDAIEIHSGGDFNYDWAIGAVVEALRNRFPDKEFMLKVEVDSRVELSANSKSLLESISLGGLGILN